MKIVSDAYKTAIRSPSRVLGSRVVVQDKINLEITDDNIESIEIDNGILSSEKFTVGGGIASAIAISLNNYDEQYTNVEFKDKWIKIYFKIELADKTYEEIYYGEYWIEESQKTGKNIKLEGFDRLGTLDGKYTTTLIYPVMISAIVADMENTLGIEFGYNLKNSTYSFNDLMIPKKPQSTYRQVLTDIATIAGGYLVCLSGIIDIYVLNDTDIEITNSNCFKTTTNNAFINLSGVNVNGFLVGDTNGNVLGQEIALLDGIGEGYLEAIAQNTFNYYKDTQYVGFNSDWQGDFAMEPCDKIKVYDEKDIAHLSIVTNNKITYSGGLKATTQAKINKDSIESGNIEIQRVQQELKENNSGIYYYTNAADTVINAVPKQLCYFKYATTSSANLILFVSASLEGTGTVEAKINVDNTEVTFKPKANINGNGVLSFTYPVLQQEGATHHGCSVTLTSTANLTIKAEQCQCVLFGQRLIGGLSDTRPHAEVIQKINYTPVDISDITMSGITQMQVPIPANVVQNIAFNNTVLTGVTGNALVDVKQLGFELVWDKDFYVENLTYNFNSGTGLSRKIEEVSDAGTVIKNEVDFIITRCNLPDRNIYYVVEEGELIK